MQFPVYFMQLSHEVNQTGQKNRIIEQLRSGGTSASEGHLIQPPNTTKQDQKNITQGFIQLGLEKF